METEIFKTLKGQDMEDMFARTDINIKYYNAPRINDSEYIPSETYDYVIVIRHPEDIKAETLFDLVLQEVRKPKPHQAKIKTSETLFLLLGDEAVSTFEEGIDEFKERHEANKFDFQLEEINDGDSLFELLQNMDGYFGYQFITLDDYKQLSTILEKSNP